MFSNVIYWGRQLTGLYPNNAVFTYDFYSLHKKQYHIFFLHLIDLENNITFPFVLSYRRKYSIITRHPNLNLQE